MKLIASVPVHNEMDRYLEDCIASLQGFCDEIRVLDDDSTDGSFQWLRNQRKVEVTRNEGPSWADHEGRFRQTLQEWTLEGAPTHILAIDADEFVSDGQMLRKAVRHNINERAMTLTMREVWSTDPWLIREDGGWKSHEVAILYRAPRVMSDRWRIRDRKMACGRVPPAIRFGPKTETEILHLGWSRPEERAARHARYVNLDGGNFHAGAHLDSIMWPDSKCDLEPYEPNLVLAAN